MPHSIFGEAAGPDAANSWSGQRSMFCENAGFVAARNGSSELGVKGRSYMQNPIQASSVLSEQTPRWFAVHTRHQHEKLVATALLSKGLEVFLPTYDAVHRWSDRNKRVTLPLFPGYLFFGNEAGRWGSILSTPGVNSIIKIGNVPAEIPAFQILHRERILLIPRCQ